MTEIRWAKPKTVPVTLVNALTLKPIAHYNSKSDAARDGHKLHYITRSIEDPRFRYGKWRWIRSDQLPYVMYQQLQKYQQSHQSL
jgi:hypothetical protein